MTIKHYLVCYDIAHPKRLGRVFRAISKHSQRVQYSVYYLACTTKELDKLLATLAEIIEEKEDDIRVYQIPSPDKIEWLGQKWLPEGIQLV